MNNLDLTTPEGVSNLMSSSENEEQWNANADKVKAANGGYPSFWFATVIISGLAAKTLGAGNDRPRVTLSK